MKKIFFGIILSTSLISVAEIRKPIQRDFGQIVSMTKRPDGNFDITCIDGTQQIKTQEEVRKGQVCEHFEENEEKWTQESDSGIEGMQFCDFDTTTVAVNGNIFSCSLNFRVPCDGKTIEAYACSGSRCGILLGGAEFILDFADAYQLKMTRVSDGKEILFR